MFPGTYPEPTIRDYLQQEGLMLWVLQVDPHAERDIRIKFFVKHPKTVFPGDYKSFRSKS
jgi:hypothetical protein